MASNINPLIPLAGSSMRAEPLKDNFAAAKTEIEALQTDTVRRDGGTMTGTLGLPAQPGPPAAPPATNEAVTRGYLDARINEAQSAGGFVPEVPPGGSVFYTRFRNGGAATWEPMGNLTAGEMHWSSGREMLISGGLNVRGSNFLVSANPGMYLDAIGNQASFCGSKVNFYTWGGGGNLNAYITGNLYQSGGEVYISGSQCRLWPSNGLYIGNGETYFQTGVRFSGGDVYMSGGAGLHLTAGLWVSGAPGFEISDWNYNIYMSAQGGGQACFAGSQFNIYRYGTGWPSAYVNITANELYISGGRVGFTSEVSFSGNRFALSGGMGVNFETGYGWDPTWSFFSVAGSSFYIESSRYGPGNMHRRKELRVQSDLQTYWGGELSVSGNMYISGGLGITCDMYQYSGDVSFSGNRFAVSGGYGIHLDSGWGWDPWSTTVSFCGSSFYMHRYRYGTGGMYRWVDLRISAPTYFSGDVGFTGDFAISGNRIAMSGYRQRLVELWNGEGGGYAIYIHDGGAWKPGGGSWSGPSDARLKTDVKDYEVGLKELLQLDPQSFRYNGRGRIQETGKRFVGVAAEQVQEVMPEMVEKVRGKLEYDDEEETEILGVNPTPLIFATLNAIKEIATTLKTIDQRLTALEDKDKK